MNSRKQRPRHPAIGSVSFYSGFFALAAAVWRLTVYINSRPYFLDAQVEAPPALSKAQDAYAAVGNLLTSLATGLLAAVSVFFTKTTNKNLSVGTLWSVVLSAVCLYLSLYFGYVSSQNVAWAIEYSIPTLDLLKLQLPRQLQFFSMLLGFCFFADFVRRDLIRKDQDERPANAPR